MNRLKFCLKLVALLFLWGFLLPRFMSAQAGIPDLAFASGNGFHTTPLLADGHAVAYSVTNLANGKIVLVGSAQVNGRDHFAALCLNANGSVDQCFGNNGASIVSLTNYHDRAHAVALQTDGKIVLVGEAGSIGAPADVEIAVVRLNLDGTLDPTFGNQGKMNVVVGQQKVACFHKDALIYLITHDKQQLVTGVETMDELEGLLDPVLFFRANRQHFIHLNAVESYRTDAYGKLQVRLKPPLRTAVDISREKAAAFKAWLGV